MRVKQIIKMIEEREKNYKKLHVETKMEGSLDKWEAMVELLIALKKEHESKNTKESGQ